LTFIESALMVNAAKIVHSPVTDKEHASAIVAAYHRWERGGRRGCRKNEQQCLYFEELNFARSNGATTQGDDRTLK
jgi:hypothetical protein